MAQTVIGIFDSANDAKNAVQQLMNNGFSDNQVDISSQSASDDYTDRRDRDDDSFGDSISNFFSNLFGSDDDARRYSEVGSRGTIVTVHANSDQEARYAAEILDQYGTVDVDQRYSQYSSGTYGAASSGTLNSTTDRVDNTTNRVFEDRDRTDIDRSIPIIEENLQVGKREVETGGVRLRSRIVERPVEENLRLRHEHVRIERNPVNRPVSASDLNTFKEGEIEMTERAEVPVVNKEARVVEEVSLSKEVEEREETIRDTVRRTEVDVENLNRDSVVDRNVSTDRDVNLRSDDDTYINRRGSDDLDTDSLRSRDAF